MRLGLLTAAGIALVALAFAPVAAVAGVPAAAAAPAAPAANCAGLPAHSNLPVVDAARVLAPQPMAYLTADLMRFTMVGDAAMVAVTVRDLGGDDIAAYARRLFDCWGIGKAESNRGVLILVAMRERRVRVEIGKGLAREIDRAELEDAVAVMAPPMKKGDVAGALREAAVAVANAMGTRLPDTAEFVRTGGGSELPDLGIPVDAVTSPGTDFADYLDDADVPTATSPFAPSPIGDGSWIPKAVVGMVVLGIVVTLGRGIVGGGLRAAGAGGTWRGGFSTFGGGDRRWSDPNLLHNGHWSTDGTWRGASGDAVVSGSGGATGAPGAPGTPAGSSGSSPFGGGTSGGGASGTW